MLDELEVLIRRINRTNTVSTMADGATVTEALARRDVLRSRHSVLAEAADAAAGRTYGRQLRSELKMFTALPVAELRATADQVARELRDLDVRIQQANWQIDLLD